MDSLEQRFVFCKNLGLPVKVVKDEKDGGLDYMILPPGMKRYKSLK